MRGDDDALVTAGAAIVVDRRGYVVGWNEGAESLLGHSAVDVLGRACHHVLCGRKPDGALVCHPWCEMSAAPQRDVSGDELVLYPRSANRESMRVVLSVFQIGGDDARRGWVVHLITSAELLPAARPLRSVPSRSKPPETTRD
jgi:PAS domain-containing protein